jgi:hypothetical protein
MPGKARKKKSTPLLLRRLRKHFGADPADLPVVEHNFDLHERPNLHLAIEEMLTGSGRKAELVGVLARDEYRSPSLGRLSREASAKAFEQGQSNTSMYRFLAASTSHASSVASTSFARRIDRWRCW